MDTQIEVRAAGVSFAPGYPRNLLDLVSRLQIEGPVDVDLVRDVDNAYDLNAVAIFLEGRKLGMLPADVSAFIAPQLDGGVPWTAEATYVPVDLDHRDRPGLALILSKEN